MMVLVLHEFASGILEADGMVIVIDTKLGKGGSDVDAE